MATPLYYITQLFYPCVQSTPSKSGAMGGVFYITRPYSYIVSLGKSICSFQNTQVLLWSS